MTIAKLLATLSVGAAMALPLATAQAQSTLRIAMTSADLPTTTGAPTQGLEGTRFAGYPVFEPLVMWDLRKAEGPVNIIPWLASEWRSDPADRNKWTFKLRRDVKFHDGSTFNADAVVWNLQRFYNDKAPQFDPAAAAYQRSRASILSKWEKIDDYTIAIHTSAPTAYFPEIMAGILIASPTQWEKVGRDWAKFGQQPSGTGPFAFTQVTRTVLTMTRNDAYWNKERMAKVNRITLQAMPEPTTRMAALMSGEVDWIEAPAPDSIPVLERGGFKVTMSSFPHIWPYWLKIDEGSPFKDVRVRQALNYAIDREGLVTLLNGSAEPAFGFWKRNDPRFGKPKNQYRYDPTRAKALLAEAGYPAGKPVKAKVMITTAGSGQMLPLQMNELIQQKARAAGFDLEFSVVDFAKMVAVRFNPSAPEMQGVVAMNSSFTTADMMWFYFSFYPKNWANYTDPAAVALMDKYRNTFEGDTTEVLARLHEKLVDDAPWAWIVHDRNPRAFSPKVKGYLPVQSWFLDLTTITVDK
ncbi:MAG: ABC transporter substrate-binding protein [Burkholderiaceae bacterium]